jgi:hypothetical protein
MTGQRTTQLASLTLAAVVMLAGCATIRLSQARDTEQLLAAGGFKMQLADTAEQQQHLAAMPPYRLLSRTKDGTVEYSFADPKGCKCVYVGGPDEYSAYQRLATERQIAQEQLWAEQDAQMGWGIRTWW